MRERVRVAQADKRVVCRPAHPCSSLSIMTHAWVSFNQTKELYSHDDLPYDIPAATCGCEESCSIWAVESSAVSIAQRWRCGWMQNQPEIGLLETMKKVAMEETKRATEYLSSFEKVSLFAAMLQGRSDRFVHEKGGRGS
jgi:hypothetical protein